MFLDLINVADFHVAAGFLQLWPGLCDLLCWLCIFDPKKPANTSRHTGGPGQAMQFLAAGHKIRTSFLRNAEIMQKNSDEI